MGWIELNEFNLPKKSEVLISNGKYVKVAEFGFHKGKYYFRNDTGIVDDITHWTYLPEPPKEIINKIKEVSCN